MRKWMACLLALALLCLCAPALAAPQAVTAGLGGELDRVKLRASPSQTAAVLGQYFANVRVAVLEAGADWSHVRVGNREGYMMSRYLQAAQGEASGEQGVPGAVLAVQGGLCVYAEPSDGSAVLGTLPDGSVTVLGTVGSDWLHVVWSHAGENQTGFVSSGGVSQAGILSTVKVQASEAGLRVNLRATPNCDAVSLGLYFSGVRAAVLFDDHTNGDGWTLVRIWDAVGYIMDDYLDFSGGFNRWLPPLSTAKVESVPLFAGVYEELATDMLARGERAAVLGVCGTRYAVRIASGASYRYGYVEQAAMEPVGRAACTEATVRQPQTLYLSDGHGGVQPQGVAVPAHAKLYILGSADTQGGPVSDGYVEPGARWLYCEGALAGGTWTDGYLPLSAVDFDSDLAYPVY